MKQLHLALKKRRKIHHLIKKAIQRKPNHREIMKHYCIFSGNIL